MKPAARILPRLTVLAIRFEDAERYTVTAFPFRRFRGEACLDGETRRVTLPDGAETLKKTPVVVFVRGHGVIAKRAAEAGEIIARVTADPERFSWSFSGEASEAWPEGGAFSFVQRTQLAPLQEALKEVPVIETLLLPAPKEGEEAEVAAVRATLFFERQLQAKALLRPSESGAMLCTLIAGRLKLPVLGLALALLAGNYFLSGNLAARRQEAQEELMALQNRQGQRERLSGQKQQLLADFRRGLPYRYAVLCDRIAVQVPPAVILTTLAVQPLQKAPAELTPLQLAERSVTIAGESVQPDAVDAFVQGLRGEFFARELTLTHMEQQRESGLFRFTIELKL